MPANLSLLVLSGVLLTSTLGSFVSTRQHPQVLVNNSDEDIRVQVYKKASPAVVTIQTDRAIGSGFIVRQDGLVLTNQHVVGDARTVTVILANDRRVEAEVIGFGDKGLDLAAVKMRHQKELPTIALARPGSIQVGQSVYAIGAPFALRGTFTDGIVSRLDRQGLIQTNAAINHGNSGGPLLNSQAQVIGINTAIYQAPVTDTTGEKIGSSQGNTGIGFAISIDQIQRFYTTVLLGNAARYSQRQSPNPENIPPQVLPLDNRVVTGQLGKGDLIFPDNSYYKRYVFKGQSSQKILIEMDSQALDPGLILADDRGTIIDQNNGISPQNLNARIVTTLPKDGIYIVIAHCLEAGELGSYTIQATILDSNNRNLLIPSP